MEREETEEKESVRKTEKERYEMKYKVGDKVRVRSDLQIGTQYGAYMFASGMVDYKGKVVTISAIDLNRLRYFIEEDGEGWRWTYEMFEGLVEDELTAEEAIKILGEICCENKCSNECPIYRAKGKMSCHFFRRDKPKDVLEIIKQFKKDNEKKEVETEYIWYVQIIEVDTHILKHEEPLKSAPKDGTIAEVLKKWLSEHDGKYYAVSERRCVVKE